MMRSEIRSGEVTSAALTGLTAGRRAELLYGMHLARRDLLVQAPRGA